MAGESSNNSLALKILKSTPILEVSFWESVTRLIKVGPFEGIWQCKDSIQQQFEQVWQVHRDLV